MANVIELIAGVFPGVDCKDVVKLFQRFIFIDTSRFLFDPLTTRERGTFAWKGDEDHEEHEDVQSCVESKGC